METVHLQLQKDPHCDCGACCDPCGHTSACMSGKGSKRSNIAEEVAQEDGYMR